MKSKKVIQQQPLTLEILDEAMKQMPPPKFPKRVRVNPLDYRRMREACNVLEILPEQPGGFTFGFVGEEIMPDPSVGIGQYEVDF